MALSSNCLFISAYPRVQPSCDLDSFSLVARLCFLDIRAPHDKSSAEGRVPDHAPLGQLTVVAMLEKLVDGKGWD